MIINTLNAINVMLYAFLSTLCSFPVYTLPRKDPLRTSQVSEHFVHTYQCTILLLARGTLV